MPFTPMMDFGSDGTLEQRLHARGTIYCMIKKAPCCFDIVADSAKSAVTKTAQEATYQTRRVVMVDLRSLTLPTCGAFAFLRLEKRVKLFHCDAVTKPQIAPTQRAEFLDRVFGIGLNYRNGAVPASARTFVHTARTSPMRSG
jgi:hypothetical protein